MSHFLFLRNEVDSSKCGFFAEKMSSNDKMSHVSEVIKMTFCMKRKYINGKWKDLSEKPIIVEIRPFSCLLTETLLFDFKLKFSTVEKNNDPVFC